MMQVNQTMDVGQWLSFMSGYRMAKNLPKSSAGKLSEFVKAINSDLRGVIETSTPIFFVYDASVYDNAFKEILKHLKTPEGSPYVVKINISQDVSIQRDDPEFNQYLSSAIASIVQPDISPSNLIKKVLPGNKTNTIESFAKVVRSAVTNLNEKIAGLSGLIAQGDTVAIGRGRMHSTAAGRLVRRDFAKLTPCRLLDAEKVVVGYDSNTKAVLIGANFANLRDGVNRYINEEFRSAIEKSGIVLSKETTKVEKGKQVAATDLRKQFKIGDFVVFGHTGAKVQDEPGVTRLLGINTPWTQQLLLIAANKGTQSSGMDILNSFAQTSGHIDISIEFSKEVSADVGILMTGSMAMVVPMLYSKNSALTRTESKAADDAVSTLYGPGSTYLKVRKSLTDTIFSAEGIKRLITGLRFSPTAAESLAEGLAGVLLGKPFKKSKAKSKKASTRLGDPVSTSKVPLKAATKVPLPKARKPTGIRADVSLQTYSLINLQDLINSQLQDVISANMGDGDARNVLNYRTGRLAASAKVESMSQSRAGMITAFYSYMKNPYATFSQGGRQSSPASRDPKLLISRSIREIAQTQVTNQLRAVNI
jgi:hypothetical protein